jgi:hypothetical protein
MFNCPVQGAEGKRLEQAHRIWEIVWKEQHTDAEVFTALYPQL